MANQKIIAEKEKKVTELAANLKESKMILLADFRGTTVDDDTKLRKSLREANGNAVVVKNNILRRALDLNGEKDLDETLVGPTVLITAGDNYTDVLKVIYKFSKSHENYTMKGGFIEGKVQTIDDLKTLAQLPSREELLSKLAGSLLQTISKLAVALDQVKSKKESEEGTTAEPAAKEEPKAEEAKAEEVKAEEPKVEEAKAEEPKTEESAEEAKVEETVAENAETSEEKPAEDAE